MAVVALFVMGGCGATVPESEDAGSVVPSLVPVVQIGCDDCEGVQQLAPVAVALGADGTVYELDKFEPHVRVFDVTGDEVAAYGRPGQGPGEIGTPLAIFPAAAGGAIVYDMPGLHEYSAAGDYLGTMTWPTRAPHSFDYLPAARVLLRFTSLPGGGGPVGGGKQLERWVLEGDQLEPKVLMSDDALPRDSRDAGRIAPLAVAVRRDGAFVLADEWEYRVYQYSAGGKQVGEFGRDVPRRPKNAAETEASRKFAERFGVSQDPILELPHFGPFALHFDSQDRLWVLTSHADDGTTTIDVFDPQGQLLAEVSLGARTWTSFPWTALAGDYLAAITEDEAAVRTVQVWRIEG